MLEQYKKEKVVEFPTFGLAVDEFFSKIESQKIEMQRTEQESVVMKRLENVKKDQQQRIDALLKDQENNTLKAQLIEANLHDVRTFFFFFF
jgi:predicted ribosome quality control (RQC) complex YloA/Tae2 family protein